MPVFMLALSALALLLNAGLAIAQHGQTGPSPVVRTVMEADVPDTCLAGVDFLQVKDAPPSSRWRGCRLDGLGFETMGAGASQSLGLRSDATHLLSMNPKVTAATTNIDLGEHNVIVATVGSGGVTALLPNAASTSVGYYKLIIGDTGTGPLTLSPRGLDTLNSRQVPMSVRGRYNGFDVWLLSSSEWYTETMESIAVDSTLCAEFGSSTHTSSNTTAQVHTPSCTVLANTMTTNTVLEVCQIWKSVTGTSPPTIVFGLRANSTVISGHTAQGLTGSQPARTAEICYTMHATALPGPAVDVITAMRSTPAFVGNSPETNTIAQPVALATDGALTLAGTSTWSSLGDGTSSVTLLAMRVSRRN